MSLEQQSPRSTDPADPEAGAAAPNATAAPSEKRGWLVGITGALLAGLIAWAIGEAFLDLFRASEEAASAQYAFERLNREEADSKAKNGAIAFGSLGALMGLVMGAAGGAAARSPKRMVIAGLIGTILGGVLTGLAPFVVIPYHQPNFRLEQFINNLFFHLAIHLGLWVPIGVAAGLAFGIGRYGLAPAMWLRSLIAGAIGAAVGTLIFEVAGTIMPSDHYTSMPISWSGETRLMARLAVALATSLAILVVASRWTARQARIARPT